MIVTFRLEKIVPARPPTHLQKKCKTPEQRQKPNWGKRHADTLQTLGGGNYDTADAASASPLQASSFQMLEVRVIVTSSQAS